MRLASSWPACAGGLGDSVVVVLVVVVVGLSVVLVVVVVGLSVVVEVVGLLVVLVEVEEGASSRGSMIPQSNSGSSE